MKKAALHNLGCKVNSYEMDVMQQKLEEKGYEIVSFDNIADIYIVNTCTVTNIADKKSRQMLHRAKQLNPDAIVVAVGCYVQTGIDAINKDEGIDLCIGNNRKASIADILEQFLESKNMNGRDKTLGESTVIDINRTDEYEDMTLGRTAEHTRAYIKIQDGCNQFCSYCAIPYARGRVRSRSQDKIMDEIRGLVENGYKEVVLTGIHISSYGIDFDSKQPVYTGRSHLIELVERIDEIDGLERIRLGSLEPRIITEENVKRLGRLKKLCPHFHLSLQSGCDETLKRMNRHYTTGEYYDSVELLRREFEHPAITTDIIVGFPGETEEEFALSRAFVEKVQFYEMHIFKYSKREGTRAALMPGHLTDRVKTLRSNQLSLIEKEQSENFRLFYLDKVVEVLFEEEKSLEGCEVNAVYHIGHTRDYIKVAVRAGCENSLSNVSAKVKICGCINGEVLIGDFVS